MFKPHAKFTAIEKSILDSVGNILPPSSQTIYRKQIARINSVQRSCRDKEVRFYCMKNWFQVAPYPDELKFSCPDEGEGYRLARVVLRNKQTQSTCKAYVMVVSGHVFEILFSGPPKLLTSQFEIVTGELLQDPMASALTLDPITDTKLPDDYVDLLGMKPEELNGWTILPPFQVRYTVDEERNVYMLAHNKKYFMGVRDEEFTGDIYLTDTEFAVWEPVDSGSKSLKECCELYEPD